VQNSSYSPVLRKPNHYQTRVKFVESWQLSRLIRGNAYILKERNHRGGTRAGNVTAMHVLDPSRVQVLVAPNGEVFYQLATDYLSGLQEATVTMPASEIIHDVAVPLYHPLCGVSPLHASGLAAMQGLKIQQHSAKHFASGSQLSGVLTAPAAISDANAKRLQDHWEANFSGAHNVGKVAVLGDGLKFEPMMMTATDAQLIEQLRWTSENICATFHVPGYMVGIGPPPPYTDIQSINLQYYTQALQNPIENIELLLEEGLELATPYGIEFDLDALARMDKKTQMEIATKAVGGGIFSPNEGRALFDRKPVTGGETPYLQAQNWPLSRLAERDVQALPSEPTTPAQTALPEKAAPADALSMIALFKSRALIKGIDVPNREAA
jgi:HK97 family phage portal protein